MKKELVKLASDLDRMGYKKTANKVDDLLLKIAQLYDSPSSWGMKSQFDMVQPQSIQQHYYEIANKKGNQGDLDSYIKDNKITDWQKERVVSAVTSDSRWEGGEGPSSDRPVTKGELEKLVMHSMDSGNSYKMKDELYERIKDFIFGDGNLPKSSPHNDLMLSELDSVERAAIGA